MKIFLLVLSVVTVMATSHANAQDTTAPSRSFVEGLAQEPHWGIGLQAGLATGTGVSVRYSFGNRFAAEVILGYLAIQNPAYSFGAEGQFLLDDAFDHRLYALAGMSINRITKGDSNNLAAPVRAGLGVGYEYFFGTQAAISGEVPITFFFQDKLQVFPTLQVQFTFYFQ